MTAPIHSDDQREFLLQLIAEGLTRDQINKRVAEFDVPFGPISHQLLYGYRKRYDKNLDALRDERRKRIFTEGLALAENRTKRLVQLATLLEEDLFDKQKRWLENTKGIGSGNQFERVTFEEFNAAEIKELRGIYEDIARETGGRITRNDVTSGGQAIKLYAIISPDDWDTTVIPDENPVEDV